MVGPFKAKNSVQLPSVRAQLLSAILLFSASTSLTQEEQKTTAASEKPVGIGLEEILVTARRTSENAQDVPIAISAMSASDLAREQINSPTDLNGKVPSLVVDTGNTMRNTETPTIRGQGSQFGSAPGVVMYMSEVALPADPVANYQGGPGKFFDLANVQILKGSQGTLFGRNTTGGAMLLEPARPHEEFSFSASGNVTRMAGESGVQADGHSYQAVINFPIIDEVLMARLGAKVFDRDGFTEDVVTGKDYDSKSYWTGRFSLLWRPTENIENYLMLNYSDSSDNGTATVIERINREGLNKAIPSAIGAGLITTIIPGVDLSQTANAGCLILNVYGPSSNCGQDVLDEQAARGVRRVQLSADPNDQLESGLYLDKLSLALNDSLSLVNIVSYSTMDHTYRWDLDGSRVALNEFINPDDLDNANVETFSEEIQLQGKALEDMLSYVIGAYYSETEAKGNIKATSLMFVNVDQGYTQSNDSIAGFAQSTIDLGVTSEKLAGLNLTAGARYTKDTTKGTGFITQIAAGVFPLADSSYVTEISSSSPTFTLGLDYKFENTMVYGKVSKGYKTGGISTVSANPDHRTFDPEYVLNYEIGQKSDFKIGDLPIRLNTAIYYTDYTDMQVSAPDAYIDPNRPSPVAQLGQANFNVGEAWVGGFEMDMMMPLSERLYFIGTYGYTEAGYNEFSYDYYGATPQLDCSGNEITNGGELELTCVPFRNVPEHQYSLSLRYQLPISDQFGELEAAITYAWVDKRYTALTSVPEAEPGVWIPAVGLTRGSIDWRRPFNSPFTLRLFGTNLENKKYRISNSNQWNLTYFQSSIYSEPRNIGLEVSYEM